MATQRTTSKLRWFLPITALLASLNCSAASNPNPENRIASKILGYAVHDYESHKDHWPDQELLPIALAYAELGKYEDAHAILTRYLTIEPGSYYGLRGDGLALRSLGRYKEAVDPLRKIVNLSGDIRALEALTDCYINLNLYDAAHQLIPQLLDHKYDDGDLVVTILLEYAYREPNRERAKDVLNSTIQGLSNQYLAHESTLSNRVVLVLRHLDMTALAYAIEQTATNEARVAVKTNPGAATINNPFINSLGMAFVPAGTPAVLFCQTDTTVDIWRKFLRDSVYAQGKGMVVLTFNEGKVSWETDPNAYWDNPGFEQTGEHPVVGVSWEDANAFCAWLSKTEGRHYRLPTDSEWSKAAGDEKYPWGNQWPPPSDAGNYPGEETATLADGHLTRISEFRDGYSRTSPVGKFRWNKYGLFDMGGNVWQWCQDEYKPSMNDAEILNVGALKDERSADRTPLRVTRGGAWCFALEPYLRTATRNPTPSGCRTDYNGLRCVLVLPSN